MQRGHSCGDGGDDWVRGGYGPHGGKGMYGEEDDHDDWWE